MNRDISNWSLEEGELSTHECPCCGNSSITVHGYIFDREGETVVYFAGYTDGHPEQTINGVLSIGGWGEGTTPADRKAVAVEITTAGGKAKVTFPAADSSPWFGEEFLGAMCSQQEISDLDRRFCCDLALYAVRQDTRIIEHMSSK